jgi:hypothetical protein
MRTLFGCANDSLANVEPHQRNKSHATFQQRIVLLPEGVQQLIYQVRVRLGLRIDGTNPLLNCEHSLRLKHQNMLEFKKIVLEGKKP